MEGFNNIFWGIFITTFNIKFGPVKILPAFIGFLLVSKGLNSLYEQTSLEKFNKARNIAMVAILMTLIGEIIEFSGVDFLNGTIPMTIWIVVAAVVELLLFFNVLEGCVEYLNCINKADIADEYIGSLRSYTIISIINIIFLYCVSLFNIKTLTIIAAFVSIVIRIYLLVLI